VGTIDAGRLYKIAHFSRNGTRVRRTVVVTVYGAC